MFKKDSIICADTGMLLIRLGLGLVFVAHGWGKFNDLSGTVGFFSGVGLPAVIAYLVSAVELLGGMAMIAGVWTKWAGWLLAIVMAAAIILVKGKMGFVGGYELDLSLLFMALGVAFAGPGTYTIHRVLGIQD